MGHTADDEHNNIGYIEKSWYEVEMNLLDSQFVELHIIQNCLNTLNSFVSNNEQF